MRRVRPIPSARFEFEGVEGLRVGRFDLGISSSCIVYRLGTTVIDTGPPNQWRVVRRFLRERTVDRALITHHHEDHSGNGARLDSELQAAVYVPRHGRDYLRTGFPLRAYQQLIWGTPPRFTGTPVPDVVACGDDLHVRPVDAPGHSPDMTCYLEPSRGWLFTGDLYISAKPRFLRVDEDVDDYIRSLRSILGLEFETLFCAHRGVIRDGRRALRAKLDYLETLRGDVRRLHEAGYPVGAIARQLLGREGFMTFFTAFHFSKRHFVRACLARGDRD